MESIEMMDWKVFVLAIICLALLVCVVILFAKCHRQDTQWRELRDCCRETDAHIIRDVVNLRNYSQGAMEGIAYLATGLELLCSESEFDEDDVVGRALAKTCRDFWGAAKALPSEKEMVPEWCRVHYPKMFPQED